MDVIGKLSGLEELDLSDTAITNTGLEAVSNLRSLHTLSLSYTGETKNL